MTRAGLDYRLQDVGRQSELLEHRPGPVTRLCVEHLRGGRIRVFAGDLTRQPVVQQIGNRDKVPRGAKQSRDDVSARANT